MPSCSSCNLVVEWGRTCYRSTWRLFRDSFATQTHGRYYRAAPGTPHLNRLHHLGSREWHSKNEEIVQTLGEDLTAKHQYDPGIPPPLLPISQAIGTRCFEDGASIASALLSKQITDGFNVACFPPCNERDEFWQMASDIDRCDLQKFYALVLERSYLDDGATIGVLFANLLGPGAVTRFHPAEGLMPAVTVVICPTCAIVVCDGTRDFQQLALQGLTSISRPTDMGPFSTLPLWFSASIHAHVIAVQDGVNPNQPVLLIGHSYGAAAALCMAGRYRFNQPDRKIRCLTFGCPKVGDGRMVKLLNTCACVNLANDTDLVTVLPPDQRTLLPVVHQLLAPQIAVWAFWQRPPNQQRLDPNGALLPNELEPLDTTTLAAITETILDGETINPIVGHRVSTYRARLTQRCPVNLWPFIDPCVPVPQAQGGIVLTGNGSGELRVPCCTDPPPLMPMEFDICTVTSGTVDELGNNMQAINGVVCRVKVVEITPDKVVWAGTTPVAGLTSFGVVIVCYKAGTFPAATGDWSWKYPGTPDYVYGAHGDQDAGFLFSCAGVLVGAVDRPINVSGPTPIDERYMLSAASTLPCTPMTPAISTTSNDTDQCHDAAGGSFAGSGFSTTPAANLLTFSLGATGHCTSATATAITYVFDTLPSALGALTVQVDNENGQTPPVQIATVVSCEAGWLDTFDAPDGTLLIDHVPELGSGYAEPGGDITIIGHKLVATELTGFPGAMIASITFNPMSPTFSLTVPITPQASANLDYIAITVGFRSVNISNLVSGWEIKVGQGGGGTIDGPYPLSLVDGTPYTLMFSDDGVNLTATMNGVTAQVPVLPDPATTMLLVLGTNGSSIPHTIDATLAVTP